jgi:hypothetical protein
MGYGALEIALFMQQLLSYVQHCSALPQGNSAKSQNGIQSVCILSHSSAMHGLRGARLVLGAEAIAFQRGVFCRE